jgi:hypothetical protein
MNQKDPELFTRFIELRAADWTFARIATELKVSKPTLLEWSRKHHLRIRNLRALENETRAEHCKPSAARWKSKAKAVCGRGSCWGEKAESNDEDERRGGGGFAWVLRHTTPPRNHWPAMPMASARPQCAWADYWQRVRMSRLRLSGLVARKSTGLL